MLPSPRGRDHPFRGWNRTLRGRDGKMRGCIAPKRGREAPFGGTIRSPRGTVRSLRGMGRSPRGGFQRTQPSSTPTSSPGRGEPGESPSPWNGTRDRPWHTVAYQGRENRILLLGDSSIESRRPTGPYSGKAELPVSKQGSSAYSATRLSSRAVHPLVTESR